ncbi:MAG: TRAP transporter small permease [Opitutales bacterium]|nr:TRAP transporter small permease [Opitutales bacterium]
MTRILQWIVIALTAVLVLDVLWGVLSRYAFGQQAKWSEELARLLLVCFSLFAARFAFAMKAHLGLDYFASKLHPSARKTNKLIGIGICLMFAVFVFLIGGMELVSKTYESGQTMVALPMSKWWANTALPASGVFMFLFLIEQFIEALATPVDIREGIAD